MERPSHLFLSLLSYLFRFCVFFRNVLFQIKILPIYYSKKKVVSIGNIVAGGTGKTSFVALLAKAVGKPVAILERGYRAKRRQNKPVICNSVDQGDEAYLLARTLDFAKVIVAKKRKDSAKMAESMKVDYILLDDGMQHRYLHRDIEIVILHSSDLFGKNAFLPRGLLRDSPKRLKAANYIVINGVRSELEFLAAAKRIREYSNAKMIGTSYEIQNVKELENKKVAAFCGIGKPDEFYNLLHSIGCRIVLSETLADHAHFDNIDDFILKAHQCGAESIVCTEKDYVKLKNGRAIIPLRVALKVEYGAEAFEQLCQEIGT